MAHEPALSPSRADQLPPGLAFVSPWIRDGGLERSLMLKAAWLRERGWRVEVLTWVVGHPPNPFLDFARAQGIPVRHLHGWGRLQLAQRAVQVAARVRLGRFQVLVGQELEGNLVALMAKTLLGGRVRVVAEVHSGSRILAEVGMPAGLVRLGRRLYSRADAVVAVSESLREDVMATFGLEPDHVFTVPNPTPLVEVRRLAREALPEIEALRPYVASAGRLVGYKSFPDLVRAFARVRAERPLRLVILGEGPEREELVRCAAACGVAAAVVLPGFVANPFAYFSRARAFVLPSRSEGQSLVLVEAMACGVPVIASRSGGPEDVLGGGRHGLLYDVGDLDGLAAALRRVLDDAEESARLGRAARARSDAFAEEAILPRLEAVYRGGSA